MRGIRGVTSLIAMILTVAVVGCAGQPKAAQKEPAQKKYAQGVSDTTIKVGISAALTGVQSLTGNEVLGATKAYLNWINEQGGVNGRKFELVSLDDNYQAPRVVTNTKRLVEQDKVFALVNYVGSAFVPGTYPILDETGIIMWAPTLPPDPGKKNVFLIGTPYEPQMEVLVDYVVSKGFKRPAAMIVNHEVGFAHLKGKDGRGIEKQLAMYGIPLIATEMIDLAATDVSAGVLKVKSLNPDVVFLIYSAHHVAQVLNEAAKLGWKTQFVGSSATLGASTVLTVAKENTNHAWITLLTEPPNSDSPKVKQAAETIAKYSSPDYAHGSFAMEAFAKTQLFVEVIRRMGDELTWENFTKQAETLKNFETGIFPPVTFGPGQHSGTSGSMIVEIRDLKQVPLTGFLEPKKQ